MSQFFHIPSQAVRNAYHFVDAGQAPRFDHRVQPICQATFRVAAHRTVNVVNQWAIQSFGHQSSQHQCSRRMGMNQLVVVFVEHVGNSAGAPYIELRFHPRLEQLTLFRLAYLRKLPRLDASKPDFIERDTGVINRHVAFGIAACVDRHWTQDDV